MSEGRGSGPQPDPAQVEELFDAVVDLPEAERAAALAQRAGEPLLRAAVERLLAADRAHAAGFLEQPAVRLDELPTVTAAPEGPAAGALAASAGALPAKVGRFEVLGQLGAGGMGVVYAARDPELNRRVALKLLRPGRGSQGAEQRLLREAQALARLSHPNVVQVYEAGAQEGQVYLAMELIEGATLRDHVLRTRPSLRALVALYLEAAQGLAAAHATGLSHRDFKPDNALVGADGRVRVADFGLAAAHAETLPAEPGSPAEPLARMTRTGALLGTPAYMAPEQLRGERATALSDQFAFCVALWEAAAGQAPFAGDTFTERSKSVLAGAVVPPPQGKLPRWLEPVLRRGLSAEPGARYPSMAELIAALAAGLPIEEARASRPQRTALVAVLMVFSWFFGAAVQAHGLPAPWSVVRLGLVPALVVSVTIWLLRKPLRRSQLNWNIARLLVTVIVGQVLHRLVLASQGATSVQLLTGDLAAIGIGLTVGAFAIHRALAWSAAAMFLAAALAVALPGNVILVYVSAISVSNGVLIFLWRRS